MSFFGDLARIALPAIGTIVAPGIGTAIGGALGQAINGATDGSNSKNTQQNNPISGILGSGLSTLGNSILPGIGGALGQSLGTTLGNSIMGNQQNNTSPTANTAPPGAIPQGNIFTSVLEQLYKQSYPANNGFMY